MAGKKGGFMKKIGSAAKTGASRSTKRKVMTGAMAGMAALEGFMKPRSAGSVAKAAAGVKQASRKAAPLKFGRSARAKKRK